jgi:hypothetical protein
MNFTRNIMKNIQKLVVFGALFAFTFTFALLIYGASETKLEYFTILLLLPFIAVFGYQMLKALKTMQLFTLNLQYNHKQASVAK